MQQAVFEAHEQSHALCLRDIGDERACAKGKVAGREVSRTDDVARQEEIYMVLGRHGHVALRIPEVLLAA